jgi:hypothetical protein
LPEQAHANEIREITQVHTEAMNANNNELAALHRRIEQLTEQLKHQVCGSHLLSFAVFQ